MEISGEMYREVAVIVPVYNSEKVLKKCINSILKQTFSEFILILVDDGSTDKSGIICDEYASKDTRICVIHQENKGSAEARKTGIFSKRAQMSEYLIMCDADDMMPKNAIEILLSRAKKANADCVCGKVRRIIGDFVIPNYFDKFTPDCFNMENCHEYSHDLIMEELYISCFGISNYPVNLWGKIYKRELLTSAAKMENIVQFMGEDLYITLNIMPNIKNLLIIPDVVYGYRFMGGTSRFMPYMLKDFLALYDYKKQLRKRYKMNVNVDTVLEIELLNCMVSYLQMCRYPGRFSKYELQEEVLKSISISEIVEAAISLKKKGQEHKWISWIIDENIEEIEKEIDLWYKKNKIKHFIKLIVSKII